VPYYVERSPISPHSESGTNRPDLSKSREGIVLHPFDHGLGGMGGRAIPAHDARSNLSHAVCE